MGTGKIIAVFGGTGKVGRHFVQQALASGYKLRVLVRNKAKFAYADHANVDLMVGDISRLKDIEATVAGADIVVSCLGNTGKALLMASAYGHIMHVAAQQKQVPRCIMISTVGVGGSSWFIKMILTLFAGKAGIEDYERADQSVREMTSVPFVLVRPYGLTDKPGMSEYKIIAGKTAHLAKPIARADVALFFRHCLEDSHWDGSIVMLAGQ